MPVGLITLEIHIPYARSLKDKRQVLNSLKDRLRGHFNVAVAELDHQDKWQRSVIGVVGISGEDRRLAKTMADVLEASEQVLGGGLISHEIEYL